MSNSTLHILGWFAYLSAIATVLTFITGVLFFSIGKTFGKINDISSVFQVLFMIPLGMATVHLLPVDDFALALVAAIIGVSGMILSATGQSLLVLGRIDFQMSRKFFPAGGAIGIWLIVFCILGAYRGQFPPLMAWFGIGAGIGYLVTVVGFLIGGQENKLFYIGAFLLAVSYPAWAIWFGRLLVSEPIGISSG